MENCRTRQQSKRALLLEEAASGVPVRLGESVGRDFVVFVLLRRRPAVVHETTRKRVRQTESRPKRTEKTKTEKISSNRHNSNTRVYRYGKTKRAHACTLSKFDFRCSPFGRPSMTNRVL